MKPKRARSSYILLLGLTSLLVVAAWLTYQIYASLTGTQITEKQKESIIPLPGTIDPKALDNLAGRRKFSQADFSSLVFNIVESELGSPEGEVATESGQL